jgi:hypothetical protein
LYSHLPIGDPTQGGIDSFAAFDDVGMPLNPSERLRRLIEQIEYADKIGLDVDYDS